MKSTINSLLVATAALLAAAVVSTSPVRADVEFAYCGFGATQGGSQSCTFVTLDQCRAYVAGGGYCQPNPRASALAEMPKRMPRR
jgi:hypothetical protein